MKAESSRLKAVRNGFIKLSADFADFRRLLRAKELKAESSRLKENGAQGSKVNAIRRLHRFSQIKIITKKE